MAHQAAILEAKTSHGRQHECSCGHEHTHEHRHEHAARAALLPLSLAQPGQSARIIAIRGRDDTKTFLCSLGFVEGGTVTVVCANGGDLIVDVKGARVAIGRQMAARVMTEPEG